MNQIKPQISSRLMLIIISFSAFMAYMGTGLTLPLIVFFFRDLTGIFYNSYNTETARIVAYSVAFGIWGAGAFLGSTYFGNLSDNIGRRTTLIIAMIILLITYSLGLMSVTFVMPIFFILSRGLIGFIGGTIPVYQAIAIDISNPKTISRNLGIINVSAAIGLMIGSFITSLDSVIYHTQQWINMTPFIVGLTLSTINFILILSFIRNQAQVRHGSTHILNVFKNFYTFIKDKRVKKVAFSYFILSFFLVLFVVNLPVLLLKDFSYTYSVTSVLFVFIGIGNVVSIFFQKYVFKKFSILKIIITNILLMIVLSGILPTFAHTPYLVYTLVFLIFGFSLFVMIGIMITASRKVSQKEQGFVFGGLGSLYSIGVLLTNVLNMYISKLGDFTAYYISIAFLVIMFLYIITMRSTFMKK